MTGAILWSLVQLGRRLHRFGGWRDVLFLQRTVLLWIIGLGNTAFARPEAVGTWRHSVGWGFLLVAVFDTVALWSKERRSIDPTAGVP